MPGLGKGIGLLAGQSAYLGTVTFHKDLVVNGFFEIAVGVDGPRGADGVINLSGAEISSTTTFNSAYLLTVSAEPPGCGTTGLAFMEIEINALRAGGKTIVTGPNNTTKVTAKARILKGTAPSGTTLVTTLSIEALDGGELIGSGSQPDITLEVGKGGKGASLVVSTEQCNSGVIDFVATFSGLDEDNDPCIGTRAIRKACR